MYPTLSIYFYYLMLKTIFSAVRGKPYWQYSSEVTWRVIIHQFGFYSVPFIKRQAQYSKKWFLIPSQLHSGIHQIIMKREKTESRQWRWPQKPRWPKGTVPGLQEPWNLQDYRKRLIQSLTLGPTTQTAFVFLKYFQAIKALGAILQVTTVEGH